MQSFPRKRKRTVGVLPRMALAAGAFALAACKKEPPAAGTDEQSLSISAQAADAPLQLTERKLTSYLGYQHRMLEVYASRLDAGGKADLARVVEAEEQVLRQSGLGRHELSAIEQMVRAVIGKRVYGAVPPGDDSLERMRAVQSKLSAEGREEVGKSIAELERSREELVRLTEERRKYGDANVDLLLAHEADLTRAWKETMATFAPRAPGSQRRP